MTGVVLILSRPGEQRAIEVGEALFVGRECAGVSDDQRVILDEPAVSRLHLELRVDPVSRRVQATDHSRNGTLLNGAEMPRGAPIVLLDGDTLHVGSTSMMVRTDPAITQPITAPTAPSTPDAGVTAFQQLPAVTAVASSADDVPDELVDRLIAAGPLFGAIADRMPGSLAIVRWTSFPPAEAEKQCARYIDFVKLLAANARVRIEWSFLRG